MDSNLFNSIGMELLDPAFYVIGLLFLCIILLILNIVAMNKIKKIKQKYDRFLTGKDAKTLEDTMLKRFEEIETLRKENHNKSNQIINIKENLEEVYQKVGIVKYDAFNEMGGKLSFSLALLNNKNTGFVLNAMHSREGCYTYIKEIKSGESSIPLGEEEKRALKEAINTK